MRAFALALLLVMPSAAHSEEQGYPQTVVAAAAVVFIGITRWKGTIDVEAKSADLAVIKLPESKGEAEVRRLTDCRFQIGEGENAGVLDFGHLSTEYSLERGGRLLTVQGDGKAPAFCDRGKCYRNLVVEYGVNEVRRVLRAIEFISANSCPLQRLPF